MLLADATVGAAAVLDEAYTIEVGKITGRVEIAEAVEKFLFALSDTE